MRGANRKRSVLISTAIILLCMSVLVGMTWALFTDTRTVNTHLKAGDMSLTLERVALTKTTLGENGYLSTVEVQKETDAPVDFSEDDTTTTADDNVFGIAEGEKIVPGTKYVAKMKIWNNKEISDVAFGYWLEIRFKDESKQQDLAEQLKITFTLGDDTATEFEVTSVENGLVIKPEKGDIDYIAAVARGEAAYFTVTVEFKDLGFGFDEDNTLFSDNNSAMSDMVAFDLVVNAVQLTTDPTPTPAG